MPKNLFMWTGGAYVIVASTVALVISLFVLTQFVELRASTAALESRVVSNSAADGAIHERMTTVMRFLMTAHPVSADTLFLRRDTMWLPLSTEQGMR